MRVVCIGSGNVATHMAHAFKAKGATIVQVWSKSLDNAIILASDIDAHVAFDLNGIDRSADLYLIAVKDDAISDVVAALGDISGLVVHTSGATDMNVLSPLKNYGVFYPLQTLSKSEPINFANVPLCIEANNEDGLAQLKAVALKLSSYVYLVNSEKRKILHLSAVFACNFVNHLYVLSAQVMNLNSLNFDMLRPLIMETAIKVQTKLPADVQTGPAVRGDEQTISKHMELLRDMPKWAAIYQTLSKSIRKKL